MRECSVFECSVFERANMKSFFCGGMSECGIQFTLAFEEYYVQFGCDSHVHFLVHRLVMSHKRCCSGTTRKIAHHRSLHLEKVAIVEKFSNVIYDLTSCDEDSSNLVVHDEIQMTFSKSYLCLYSR